MPHGGRRSVDIRALYRHDQSLGTLRGMTAVLVDDGIATGATVEAAAQGVRSIGCGRLIIAAPVASRSAVHRLKHACDEIYVLETPADFWAVGQHYRRFEQTGDAEVVALLRG